MTRLTGLSALITGGGTGMGRAIALAFAREGTKVAVASRRVDKLQSVAEMAVYLVSKESAWMTGVAVPLDRGLTAY